MIYTVALALVLTAAGQTAAADDSAPVKIRARNVRPLRNR